jgi:hypothetical protein
MLPNPRVHSVGVVGSGSARIVEGVRNQAPPIPGVASLRERRERQREVAPASLVALAYFRDEPVIGGHAVDVKLPSACRCADDPLAGRAVIDGKLVVIVEALVGSGHAQGDSICRPGFPAQPRQIYQRVFDESTGWPRWSADTRVVRRRLTPEVESRACPAGL